MLKKSIKGNEVINVENGVATIKCSNCDDTFTVDESKLDEVIKKTWHKTPGRDYICTTVNMYDENGKLIRNKNISLHRYLLRDELNKPENEGMVIDHIDRNPKNNTLSNLRVATNKTNNLNRSISINSKTGLRGVCEDSEGMYQSRVSCGTKKSKHIGRFEDPYDAALAYDRYVRDNFPEDIPDTNYMNNKYPQEILDKYNIKTIDDIKVVNKMRNSINDYHGISFFANKYWVRIRYHGVYVLYESFDNQIDAIMAYEDFLATHPEINRSSNIEYKRERGKINIAGMLVKKYES